MPGRGLSRGPFLDLTFSSSLSGGRRRFGRLPAGLPLVAAATAVAAVSLVPLGFIVWITVASGWDTVAALVFRARVATLLANTALLEALTLPIAIVLSVALAWLTERTDLPGARLWSWLAVAPLAVPAFVHSYAWNTVAPGLHGLAGSVLIGVLAYSPFLYLPVAAQLRRLDPALEDAAASLGLGPWAVFFRVVLPQLRLAIAAGALLVALHLLAEYGLYALMRFDTFATAIIDQFQSIYSGPGANLLGGVLVLLCLLLLAAEALARGRERYARVGSGAPRAAPRRTLGAWTPPALALPIAFALLSLGTPLLTLGRWLVIGGAGIWRMDAIRPAIEQTVLLSIAGAAVATLAAFPMAWLAVRSPGRPYRLLEAAHYYVGALPGVIVALALVSITVRVAQPLYQTVATLLLAYLLMFLPRALVGLRASIAQAPVELEHAAMSLGRPPLAAIARTTMRLAAPGIAASMALVALGIGNELTGTLLLAPNGTRTLATRFWAYASELDFASAAPYALLMILLSLPLVLLLRARADRMLGR
jgi:iron(III) transport system permease protein